MKKKILLVFLLLAAVLMLSACAKKEETYEATSNSVPTVLNTSEYVLYQNIFYNNYGSRYDGKTVTKHGIFTTIQDAYSDVTRYYVWGYNDMTKCCDWQWELNVTDAANLPANGSLIDVKGTFASSGSALDGYWIEKPEITLLTAYTGKTAELDMTTMSDTLERVQLINVMNWVDKFAGKSVYAYGRILDTTTLQDPYYDGSWTTAFSSADQIPATGTSVVLRGTVAAMQSGDRTTSVIDDAKIELMN